MVLLLFFCVIWSSKQNLDMKKLTLFLGALCLVAFASAQRVNSLHTFEHTITKASEEELINSRLAGVEALASQRGGGSILFQEDFSNGFEGSNGNGAWTTFDNANDSGWVYVGADGFGTYSSGNATGVEHPGGEYSTNIGPLESETPDNGWMIFDSDFFNTPIAEGYQDMDGSLTSPVIDFSNDGSVVLNWIQYFRYCCYPYAPIYVDVTNDGGETWTTFDAHGSFIEAANTASANPLPTSLDISCVAAYQSEVQFRFTYTQAPETGNAYSHYYWGIDDVVVTSNPNADDLEIVQLTNGDIWNVWEYRVTPMEQTYAAADGGVLAGVLYRNSGTNNQENVDIIIDVLSGDGSTVLNTVTESIDVAYSFANALDCPANAQDTIYIPTGWEPSETGNYILRATIDAGTEDATPENNVMSKVIVFTDDEYGHDDEAELSNEAFPRESESIPGLYDPTGQGNFYHTVNGGSTAYGLTVAFGSSCGTNQDGEVAELEFETRLYYYDNTVGITDSDFESTYWTFDPAWAGTTQYLAFEDPIELDAQTVYFVGVIAEYESEGALTVSVQPDSDTDNSTGEYNVTGDGDYVWFTSQTYTPGIRLILSERVSVDEIASLNGITLLQNRPNPATNITTFSFELNSNKNVQFEIRDISGRVVANIDKGSLGAGTHTIDFDVTSLSSGMYTYTLVANGVSVSKKMTVK